MPPRPENCLSFLSVDGCAVQDCPRRHDIQLCSCGLVIPLKHFDEHFQGRRHRTLAALKDRHPAAQWNLHPLQDQEHLTRQRIEDIKIASQEAERDKGGIIVSGKNGIDFGVVAAGNPTQPLTVTIRKTDTEGRIFLADIRMRSSVQEKPSSFSAKLQGDTRWISADCPRSLMVLFFPSSEGRYEDILELTFHDYRCNRRFTITRPLYAIFGSKDDHESLRSKGPYVKRKSIPILFDTPIFHYRPPTWSTTKWVTFLPLFKPPHDLIKAAYGNNGRDGVKKFMPKSFSPASYGKHFQVLLYLEQEQMSRDLDQFSMAGIELKPAHPRYKIEVPGLEEGRPSVLVGDFVLVRHTGRLEDPWYEGSVHEVSGKDISLRFRDGFSTYRGTKFDVRFQLNRLPIRRMLHAVATPFNPTRILFPDHKHVATAIPVSSAQMDNITPVNRLIKDDIEQWMTVTAIVHQPPGSVPFVVFGPPGTGKTVTIVEAIRQLLIRNPESRILACAPSNSAADLIAENLSILGTMEVFRLNSLSRPYEKLPHSLRAFSLFNGNLVFAIPTLETLQKYRVIVSTCISGAIPSALGIQRGHFSHVFIDEAGQATEPEVMVPIKTIADKWTNIILAGDNKQLGPIVCSVVAMSLGLKESYLSRIMSRQIYDLNNKRGVTIVKLVKNFRSHPAILAFSNQHFYDDELRPCGDQVLTHSLVKCSQVVTKHFPVVFHGIVGKDEREESSPSFFNIDEATMVKNYCLSLTGARKNRVRPQDIGVITPYHAQRCKISKLLRNQEKLRGITIGSVEEFQGQERRVIIISTVRSTTDFIRADIKRTLGFVANPPRLNVAITRAQALLIVVGNPTVLSLDPTWRSFLNYIHSKGGWRGQKMEWDPEAPILDQLRYDDEMRQRAEGEADDLIKRLKALITQTLDPGDFVNEDHSDSGSEGDVAGYIDTAGRGAD